MSSGSAVSPWQINNDPIVASKQVLRILGCDSYTINPLSCLRSKKTEHILQALQEYSDVRKLYTYLGFYTIDAFRLLIGMINFCLLWIIFYRRTIGISLWILAQR